MSKEFNAFCEDSRIKWQLMVANTLHQNDVAKRKNRTIFYCVKSMPTKAQLPTFLWIEVVNMTTYLINCSPSKALGRFSPKQIYSGKPPKLGHLKAFGCLVYVHIPKMGKDKLEPRALKGVNTEYNHAPKAYRIYNPQTKKIIITKDISFDEGIVGITSLKEKDSMRAMDNSVIPLKLEFQQDEPIVVLELDGKTLNQ